MTNLLKQHRAQILNTIGVCCALALLSYFVLPRKYKVSTSISVPTQYFQLPLVSSFIPETLDPQELRAKREALIHRALDQKFLSQIAVKYHLLKSAEKLAPNSHELELLAKRFEVIPNGPSGFIINFIANSPTVAYEVLQDFLNRLQSIMAHERHLVLLNLHDAIQEQLETISISKQGENANAIFASRPDLVQRRIEKIQEEIETLKNFYSEKHPRIAALKEQLVQLNQWVRPTSEQAPTAQDGDIFTGLKVDESSRDLFNDLMKKYRYLEIVIYMDRQSQDQNLSFLKEPYVPSAPIWPKLPILLAWGIAVGFLIGSVRVLMKSGIKTIPNPFTVIANEVLTRENFARVKEKV